MCSLYLYYWEDNNMFIDECGEVIYDIFTLITPQDLFLFHSDHKFNEFPMIGHEDLTCAIVIVPQDGSLYWMPGIDIEQFMYLFTNLKMKK